MTEAPQAAPSAIKRWIHDLRLGSSTRNGVLAILTAIFLVVAEFSSSQMRAEPWLAILLATTLSFGALASITGLRVRTPGWRHRLGSLISALGGVCILGVGGFFVVRNYAVSTRIVDVHLLSVTVIVPVATALLLFGGLLQLPARALWLGSMPLLSSIGLAAVIVRQDHLHYPSFWVASLAGITVLFGLIAAWNVRHCTTAPALKLCHAASALGLSILAGFIVAFALMPQTSWADLHHSGALTWGSVALAMLLLLSTMLPHHPVSQRTVSKHKHDSTSGTSTTQNTKSTQHNNGPHHSCEAAQDITQLDSAANSAQESGPAQRMKPASPANRVATTGSHASEAHQAQLADGTALYKMARAKVAHYNAQTRKPKAS
ncbi:MAG: hypothetical protein Q3976_05235 [Corynebacterium sp.]|nr:hypothetical protein [Corynebacterium sp.]